MQSIGLPPSRVWYCNAGEVSIAQMSGFIDTSLDCQKAITSSSARANELIHLAFPGAPHRTQVVLQDHPLRRLAEGPRLRFKLDFPLSSGIVKGQREVGHN
jgi:hypothetical protein